MKKMIAVAVLIAVSFAGFYIPAAVFARDESVYDAQALLKAPGYYTGPIDGILGTKTINSIKDFQKDIGSEITGSLDEGDKIPL